MNPKRTGGDGGAPNPEPGAAGGLASGGEATKPNPTPPAGLPVAVPCKESSAFTAVSFNFWFEESNWAERLPRIVEQVGLFEADLLGLQEAKPALRQDLKQIETHGVQIIPAAWVPTAFRPTRFDVAENGRFWLSETPDVSSGYQNVIREAAWARLTDEVTGRSVLHINTHFPSGPGDHLAARRVFGGYLRTQIGRLRQREEAVVLTGDLNGPPTEQGIQTLLSPTGDGPQLFHSFSTLHPDRLNEGTANAYETMQGKPGRHVDYVLHTADLYPLSARIWNEPLSDGGIASDHFAVSARLAWARDDDGVDCPR